MQLDSWEQKSYRFLVQHLERRKAIVRIATGFFSVAGFNLLRTHLADCKLQILVGYDERRSHDELRQSVLQELLDTLALWDADRRTAVLAMVEKLQADELTIMDARARLRDHGKVYIIDNHTALIGSTNFTRSGLLMNFESNAALTEPDRVNYFIEQFTLFWFAEDTLDISAELLARLLKWLELRSPWDVYLKAAYTLLHAENTEPPRENYRQPADFQLVVIRRVLEQLERYRGAFLIASTGLGKTVMATHLAWELRRKNLVTNVLVIAPVATHEEWGERLLSAGVAARIFSHQVFDKRNSDSDAGKVARAQRLLAQLDDRWLIIIDESHHFKNRMRAGDKLREAFRQLPKHIERANCRVLLLTATPFATEIDNINHQLLLLPYTTPSDIAETFPFHPEANAWRVRAVSDVVDLAVATVLNAPFVAKNYSHHDPEHNADYIVYPDGRTMYFPSLTVTRIPVPLPLVDLIAEILDSRLFQQEMMPIPMRKGVRNRDDTPEYSVATAWASSPLALIATLKDILAGEYAVTFVRSSDEDKQRIQQAIAALEALTPQQDNKFMTACALVEDALARGEKVIIFVERYATADYLAIHFTDLLPQARVASTVTGTQKSGWRLLSNDQISSIIRHFAPQSNRYETGDLPKDDFDVLITTDRLAEGVNLQDASVLLNYDITWSADTFIQRAGRVMRLWETPRELMLYAFVPDEQYRNACGNVASLPWHRLDILETRLQQATPLSEINMLPKETHQHPRLAALSTQTWHQQTIDMRLFVSPELASGSSVLADIAIFNQHREHAASLPDDIATAFITSAVTRPQLVSIVRIDQRARQTSAPDAAPEFVCLHYDPTTERVTTLSNEQLFQLIRCTETTPVAAIDAAEVETLRHACLRTWQAAQRQPTSVPADSSYEEEVTAEKASEQVRHICTLYLLPKGSAATLY